MNDVRARNATLRTSDVMQRCPVGIYNQVVNTECESVGNINVICDAVKIHAARNHTEGVN